ncbi:hypothetical protein HK101_003057, partial [Irineochytrium annulatum]
MPRARLHWDEIRDVKRDTVWNEPVTEEEDTESEEGTPKRQTVGVDGITLDVKKFEELFCIVPGSDKKKGAPKIVQLAQFTTVLDLRRANNVSIGLSRYTRRNMNAQDIMKAIVLLDENQISVDDVVSIQSLLPTADERTILKAAETRQKPGSLPFAPAETFMLAMMKDPDLEQCLNAFGFKLQLGPEIEEVGGKVAKMTSICIKLKTSDALKVLLRTVLQLGNMTNYEYGAGNSSYRPWMGKEARALGFKIEGLARLKDVKSADGKWSLMNFLVDMVTQSKPEVLDFTEDFADMKVIRHYDLRELSTQLLLMDENLAKIRSQKYVNPDNKDFDARISPFLDKAATMITGLRLDFETFTKAWADAAKYFGEDLEDYQPIVYQAHTAAMDAGENSSGTRKSPTHLFSALDMFLHAFEDAVKQNRKRVEDEARREKREAQAAEEKKKREEARLYRERVTAQQKQQRVATGAQGVLAALFGGASIAPPKSPAGTSPTAVVVTPPDEQPMSPMSPEDRASTPLSTTDESAGGPDDGGHASLLGSHDAEAKEMFKRFSLMQALPPEEDDEEEFDGASDGGDGNEVEEEGTEADYYHEGEGRDVDDEQWEADDRDEVLENDPKLITTLATSLGPAPLHHLLPALRKLPYERLELIHGWNADVVPGLDEDLDPLYRVHAAHQFYDIFRAVEKNPDLMAADINPEVTTWRDLIKERERERRVKLERAKSKLAEGRKVAEKEKKKVVILDRPLLTARKSSGWGSGSSAPWSSFGGKKENKFMAKAKKQAAKGCYTDKPILPRDVMPAAPRAGAKELLKTLSSARTTTIKPAPY